MDVSVIIPTFGRAEKLGRCVARLARQDFPRERFEVLVGVDGRSEQETGDAVHEIAARAAGSVRCEVFQFDHAGPGVTRNRLIERANGKLILMLNDDVLAAPDLITRHVEAHEQLQSSRHPSVRKSAMILGAAPWLVPADDSLFDRLSRETSMIFFYDRMDAALSRSEVGPDHDWGFRHAWTLNLSMPRAVFDHVGGFDTRLRFAMFEDLEFAYRARTIAGAPVLYRPAAIVEHDHRISVTDYLARERKLGLAAWELAGAAPNCAAEVFRRDIRSSAEIADCRAFIDRERDHAAQTRERMHTWQNTPANAVAASDLPALYESHLIAKRWEWRMGLLEAADCH